MDFHQRDRTLYAGRDPLPSVEAFIKKHEDELSRPGSLSQIIIEHDADCPYPRGFPCRCIFGPECRIVKIA